jgi:hypothetical protein
MLDAKAYAQQIRKLEAKLASAIDAVPLAERALADAFASSDDAAVKRAHAALVEARDSVPALRAALDQTDKACYDLMVKDYEAAKADLYETAKKDFARVAAEIRKAAGPLEKILAEAIPDAGSYLKENVIEPALDAVWLKLDTGHQEKLRALRRVPRFPKRNERGAIIQEA